VKKPTLLRTGSAADALQPHRGDYEAWFARTAGLPEDRFTVIDGTQPDTVFPDPGNIDGLIITGSSAHVHDHEAWSVRCGAWSRAVLEAGVPVLGVCYGHQLLADALGGDVGPNPNGREMGMCEVQISQADPLFEHLGDRFYAALTHLDAVNTPPSGARVLAHNALTEVQAMALGSNGRTVQFHPEYEAQDLAYYINLRRHLIDGERGPGTADAWLAGLHDNHTGQHIMRNFLRHWMAIQCPPVR
jgi:GMP synthase (glutamine-hydrolysing)